MHEASKRLAVSLACFAARAGLAQATKAVAERTEHSWSTTIRRVLSTG
ncbi:hypothetical protein HNO52_04925 [Billgrantia diversa]|nr:hypothetical protein [Halomonas sp. MCCC 1A13316]QOR37920.1 hypothetical protein HNO52_04925 [Halomonas sp. MCCC 1A13316]